MHIPDSENEQTNQNHCKTLVKHFNNLKKTQNSKNWTDPFQDWKSKTNLRNGNDHRMDEKSCKLLLQEYRTEPWGYSYHEWETWTKEDYPKPCNLQAHQLLEERTERYHGKGLKVKSDNQGLRKIVAGKSLATVFSSYSRRWERKTWRVVLGGGKDTSFDLFRLWVSQFHVLLPCTEQSSIQRERERRQRLNWKWNWFS